MTDKEFDTGLGLITAVNGNMAIPEETRVVWFKMLEGMTFGCYKKACRAIAENEQFWSSTNLVALVKKYAVHEEPQAELLALPPHGDPKVEALIMGLVKKFRKAMRRGDKQGMDAANKELKEMEAK